MTNVLKNVCWGANNGFTSTIDLSQMCEICTYIYNIIVLNILAKWEQLKILQDTFLSIILHKLHLALSLVNIL